jgi:hypothetical protein|mmetsp:Transcript_38007/g.60220  ORF Transcript_38007/g.60220 Transcript_38007/m.60220 type:complete len:267 (+) Transcript_38007:62-862(+)
MKEQDGLNEDLPYEADLEGFFNGTAPSVGMVNLQPLPTSCEPSTTPSVDGVKKDDPAINSAASIGAAAAAAAVGSALIGGKFSDAHDIMGKTAGNLLASVGTAAIPTSLQPVKETAGRFLQKAQPWREFLLPLSTPDASAGCARLMSNIYQFQTNYAILFVVQLVISILLQPSALMSIVLVTLVWVVFMKKNDDPDWHPTLAGVQLGPMQRWLLLAAITALILLTVAGNTIFNAALMYCGFVFLHGLVHDVSGKTKSAQEISGTEL